MSKEEQIAKKLKKKKFPYNPLINELPDFVKDIKNYDIIQREIFNAGKTDCKHRKVITWTKCKKCQAAQKKRAKVMEKYGFVKPGQYLLWRKTIEVMIRLKDKPWMQNYK